jgi:hypothetical protein
MQRQLRVVRDSETEAALRGLGSDGSPEEKAAILVEAGLPAEVISVVQPGNQRGRLINDLCSGVLALISEGGRSLQESGAFMLEPRAAAFYSAITYDADPLEGTSLIDLFPTDPLGALALIEFAVRPAEPNAAPYPLDPEIVPGP